MADDFKRDYPFDFTLIGCNSPFQLSFQSITQRALKGQRAMSVARFHTHSMENPNILVSWGVPPTFLGVLRLRTTTKIGSGISVQVEFHVLGLCQSEVNA